MPLAEILSTVRNLASSSSKTNSEFKNEAVKNNKNIDSAIKDISRMFQSQMAENSKSKSSNKVILDTIRSNSKLTDENNVLLKQSISLQNDMMDQLKQISSSVSSFMQQLSGTEDGKKSSPLDKALEASSPLAMMAGLLAAGSVLSSQPQGGEQTQGGDVFGGGGSDSNSMVGASQYDQGKVTLTSEDQKAIIDTAQNLGIDPVDLSTVISYETSGTFNPNKMGGKGGNYMGLIQFGPEERKKYGVKPGMTIAEQMSAVESFLTDRGLKKWLEDNPDASLADKRTALYSTINAGSPGEKYWSRSDRPGSTVQSHTMSMFAGESGHYKQGAQFLETAGYSPGSQNNIETTSESGVIPTSSSTGGSAGVVPETPAMNGGGVEKAKVIESYGGKRPEKPDQKIIDLVQQAATEAGMSSVTLTSGKGDWISPSGKKKGQKTTAHSTGLAVDISSTSFETPEQKYEFIKAAKRLGAGGVGTYSHGGLHIDLGKDRSWNWGGEDEKFNEAVSAGNAAESSNEEPTGKTSTPYGGASERLIPGDISGNLSGASDVLSGGFGMNFNGAPSESMTPMGSLNVGDQIETITNSINNILPSNPNDVISQIQTLISENITPNISRPTPSEGAERRLETSPYSDQTNTRASWWRLGLFPDRKLMEKFSNRFV